MELDFSNSSFRNSCRKSSKIAPWDSFKSSICKFYKDFLEGFVHRYLLEIFHSPRVSHEVHPAIFPRISRIIRLGVYLRNLQGLLTGIPPFVLVRDLSSNPCSDFSMDSSKIPPKDFFWKIPSKFLQGFFCVYVRIKS